MRTTEQSFTQRVTDRENKTLFLFSNKKNITLFLLIFLQNYLNRIK